MLDYADYSGNFVGKLPHFVRDDGIWTRMDNPDVNAAVGGPRCARDDDVVAAEQPSMRKISRMFNENIGILY